MQNEQNFTPATLPMVTSEIKFQLDAMSTRIDEYSWQMQSLPSPTLLIFHTTKDRGQGFRSEVNNAKDFGHAIGAKTYPPYKDPTSEELLRIVGNESMRSTCLIVAIMCHGLSGIIELADGSVLEVKDVIDAMDTRFMSEKPKVSCTFAERHII